MAYVRTEGSIALMIHQCDIAFKKLYKALKSSPQDHEKELEQCSDEIGRFNGWERDVDGKTGHLDYRLRRSPQLHEQVMKLLTDVDEAFKRVSSNLSSRSASPVQGFELFADDSESSDVDSLRSSANDPISSISQMLINAGDIVTCLLELKSAIDDPIPDDQISRTFDSDAAHFDIQHVKEKFPKASKSIVSRLGRANWRRRHYLIGLQSLGQPETGPYGGPQRQSNLVKELRPSQESSDDESSNDEQESFLNPDTRSVENSKDGQSSSGWSRDSELAPTGTNPTTISSVQHGSSKKPQLKAMPLTGHLPVGRVTAVPQSRNTLPPGPSMLCTGKPFRCSYCGLELVDYKRNRQWRKHVISDIEPYICTFEHCKCPEKTYGSRNDWLYHEYRTHQTERRWDCRACDKIYLDQAEFKVHLEETHNFNPKSEQLWTAIEACEVRSPIPELRTECPLCRRTFDALKPLEKHLADHLEELALFATVSAGGQDDEYHDLELLEDSDVESDDAPSKRIGSVPDSTISVQQTQKMHLEKYFDVMSQFTTEPTPDVLRRSTDTPPLQETLEAQVQFPIFAVFHTANEFFYGRDKTLAFMNSELQAPGKTLAIHGIGGVGKTELAIQYAYRYKEEYECIFWIQADTDPGLVESFCQIATTLDLLNGTEEQNQIIELGREWLGDTYKRWLLIFDNLEQWDNIVQYLPRGFFESTVGHVILTTQHRIMADRSSANVELTPFEDEEGARMLLHYMKRKKPYDKAEMSQAREISSLLGGLPVAVSHVSGYVVQSDCDLEELLEIFKDRRRITGVATLEEDDLPAIFRKPTFSFDETLAVVWNITLRELPKDAQDLIYILAYLNSEAVPESLLHTARRQCDSHTTADFAARYKKMKRQLLPRRLVQEKKVDKETCLSIHRSLQRSIRETLSQSPLKAQEVFKQAFTIIRQAFPAPSPIQVPNAQEWMVYQRLLPHVYALKDAYAEAGGKIEGTRDFVELLSDAGINQWERGITRDGLLLLRTAEEVLSQLEFDGADLQKANIDTSISLMFDNTGISQRAEGFERRREVLDIRKKYFKAPSPVPRNEEILLYNSWMDYSISLLQYNKYADAKTCIERCFQRYQAWGNEEDLPFEYSKYHHWIGIIYMYEGHYEEAIRHGEISVKLMASADNESLKNRFKFDLACIILQSGNAERALQTHEEVYRARLRTSGKTNELTLHSCYAIGAIHETRGSYAQAERWFTEAMNQRRSAHWSREAIARTQFHLSRTLRAQNKSPEKADKLYEEAKAILDHLFPLDSPEELRDVKDESILFDHLLTVCAARFTGTELLKLVR